MINDSNNNSEKRNTRITKPRNNSKFIRIRLLVIFVLIFFAQFQSASRSLQNKKKEFVHVWDWVQDHSGSNELCA